MITTGASNRSEDDFEGLSGTQRTGVGAWVYSVVRIVVSKHDVGECYATSIGYDDLIPDNCTRRYEVSITRYRLDICVKPFATVNLDVFDNINRWRRWWSDTNADAPFLVATVVRIVVAKLAEEDNVVAADEEVIGDQDPEVPPAAARVG